MLRALAGFLLLTCLLGCTDRLVFNGTGLRSGVIPNPPPGSTVISDIDKMQGWSAHVGGEAACPSYNLNCAGGSSIANYAPKQTVAVPNPLPNTDGFGALFQLFQSPPNVDLLYGKSLGPHNDATHFIWDFWVYVDTNSINTLEYDLAQSIGGARYMIGSQCDYSDGKWDGWDELAQRWVPIEPSEANNNLQCTPLAPYQWHHIVWYTMLGDGFYSYLALEVDGVGHPINLPVFQPRQNTWADTIVVQVQMDANRNGAPINQYIQSMSVTLW